ncbi:AEC family transporter [Streptomyces poriferorum]|uniref:AEC family transporter n=2 Tax=Streptomyces poriferorum TaxID=2798799 RepID=A0ABY9IW44_9ACTN|nr:AEC family transporter [Streptomyces sp. Alt2]WLQ59230.1 AEC family transporter [Streptomyces sp. Alt2]
MHALLSGFAPIWILTGIGYAAGRGGLLGEQAESVLGRFVFHVAMPAALFTMVSGSRPGAFAHPSMVAFAAGTVLVSALGYAVSRRFFGRERAAAAVSGMASGYVNSANLGIPVAVHVLGDASFVAQVILFQVLFVSPVVLTLLDSGTQGGGAATGGLRRMLTMPVRNPVILASLLGVAVSAAGWQPPAVVTHSCDVLGAAAVPTALITLGLSLCGGPGGRKGRAAGDGTGRAGGRREAGVAVGGRTEAGVGVGVTGRTEVGVGGRTEVAATGRTEVGAAVALKTVVQPLVAFLVAGPLLGLPDHQVLAVVLCSALPTAQNAYLYAREYGLDTGLARHCVVASTVVSMGTLSFGTWVLGPSR